MLILVTGGAASGKSAYAEQLAEQLGQQKIYVATMEPFGEEANLRIQKHRQMRASKGFQSVDCYRKLQALNLPPSEVVLLECVTNLLANELYGGDAETVLEGIQHLLKQTGHLIVVSGEVFSDGMSYSAETMEYIEKLACLNRKLAEQADLVVESVAGLAVIWKGREWLEKLV